MFSHILYITYVYIIYKNYVRENFVYYVCPFHPTSTHTFVSCNNTFIPTFISFIHAFKPSLHSNKNYTFLSLKTAILSPYCNLFCRQLPS